MLNFEGIAQMSLSTGVDSEIRLSPTTFKSINRNKNRITRDTCINNIKFKFYFSNLTI